MGSDDSPPTPSQRPHLRLVPRPPEASEVRDRQAELRDAYVFAARLLLAQPAACRVGYRLFWVHGRDLGWIDLEASPFTYAVLGWHDQCDLKLPRQSRIANRHLLASSYYLADGTVALRLLDLQSGNPFTIEGQPRQSVCVSGPLLVGVGDCALGCVPLPEFHRHRGDLPDGFEVPRYTTSESLVPPEASQRLERSTHITVLPRVSQVQDLVRPPSAPPGFARFTLRRQTRACSVEVSQEDLYAGILIGRAETCMDRGLRHVLSAQISRLHILLLAERGEAYAFDLCSTNGTWLSGSRVRRILLTNRGIQLVLSGNESKVELLWHPREVAPNRQGPGSGSGVGPGQGKTRLEFSGD